MSNYLTYMLDCDNIKSNIPCKEIDDSALFENIRTSASVDDSFAFFDPRQGKTDNRIYPKQYYIVGSNVQNFTVKGINFYDKNLIFVCSYCGENFSDIVRQNLEDLNEFHKQDYTSTNVEDIVKKRNKTVRGGDRNAIWNIGEIKGNKRLIDNERFIEMSRDDYPFIFDKYDNHISPISGNLLYCIAVYTTENALNNNSKEAKYVEYLDNETREKFYYLSKDEKSIDEQISEDLKLVISSKKSKKDKEKEESKETEGKEQSQSKSKGKANVSQSRGR